MVSVYDRVGGVFMTDRLEEELIGCFACLFMYTNSSPWQFFSPQFSPSSYFVFLDFYTKMTLLGPVRGRNKSNSPTTQAPHTTFPAEFCNTPAGGPFRA